MVRIGLDRSITGLKDEAGKAQAMERLPKLDTTAYITVMRQEFERVMQEVAKAVNDAPEGRVVNASEERVRDVMAEFRAKAYQEALQMRVDAAEAAFSPCRQGDGKALARQGTR